MRDVDTILKLLQIAELALSWPETQELSRKALLEAVRLSKAERDPELPLEPKTQRRV